MSGRFPSNRIRKALLLLLTCLPPAIWAAPSIGFNPDQVWATSAFNLELTFDNRDPNDPVAPSLLWTTDGSEPNPENGHIYTSPIPITSTTCVRARAFHRGKPVSRTFTRSCFFPERILSQPTAMPGFPNSWGYREAAAVPADYEMDPEITTSQTHQASLRAALRSIPTVSLVGAIADWFDARSGIYSNPLETGASWERPVSFEFIDSNGVRKSEVACGVRIQGGWNRRPEESPKHSLRLLFKKKYGPGKLNLPVYGEVGPARFDSLVLRGGCNNTWLHWSGEERRRGDFIRDQWMRDSAAAMGQTAARGVFVHLFINGLYWGLYNLAERPDADFLAAHESGKTEDYDARNADSIISGDDKAWKELFQLANKGATSLEAYSAISQLLDIDAFIDYMLLNFYGANADWDRSSNWYAGRKRTPAGRFRFFVWDGERTLEQPNDCTIDFDDDLSPSRLFHKLAANQEFRARFSQRTRQHCAGNGALTPARAASRFERLAKTIEPAIILESARWGDYRRDVHRYKSGPYELYTPATHWRPEIDRLLRDYFPQRTSALLKQLEQRKLF